MVDRVGQQFGNYRLTQLLGSGGFADVYLGKHVYLDTHQAAIKVLRTQMPSEDKMRFRSEARTLARLWHPRIVRLLDFSIEGNTPFMVMEYVPNGTLCHRYPRGMRLPLPTIVSHILQLADALQYAHNQKLIHRDIKPANMFLGRHNEVLLGDFGIAILTQSIRSQSSEEIIGTWTYTAPEQLQGRSVLASDQYALGIVVYEWLTGDVPFHGSFMQLLYQHTYTPPPFLHEKIPNLPQGIEQVVMRAIAKDPQARFASVREFAQALASAWEHTNRIASESTIPAMKNMPLPVFSPAFGKSKEQWVRKGITHYHAKQYREAIAAYSFAIELAPTYTQAYALRGQAYSCLKEYQLAVKDFDQALKLEPNIVWIEIEREKAYRQLKRK